MGWQAEGVAWPRWRGLRAPLVFSCESCAPTRERNSTSTPAPCPWRLAPNRPSSISSRRVACRTGCGVALTPGRAAGASRRRRQNVSALFHLTTNHASKRRHNSMRQRPRCMTRFPSSRQCDARGRKEALHTTRTAALLACAQRWRWRRGRLRTRGAAAAAPPDAPTTPPARPPALHTPASAAVSRCSPPQPLLKIKMAFGPR